MTEIEALKVLESATAMLQLTRKDHEIIATALQVLAKAVQSTPKSVKLEKAE